MCGKVELVQFAYPQPGHSHNAVDAVFGSITGRMRRANKVTTLPKLHQVFGVFETLTSCKFFFFAAINNVNVPRRFLQ